MISIGKYITSLYLLTNRGFKNHRGGWNIVYVINTSDQAP